MFTEYEVVFGGAVVARTDSLDRALACADAYDYAGDAVVWFAEYAGGDEVNGGFVDRATFN